MSELMVKRKIERSSGTFLLGDSFDNLSWRTLISDVLLSLRLDRFGASIISPWGFELLENKLFLKKKLRRFYCYIGIKDLKQSRELISHLYKEKLKAELKIRYPEFYEQVVLYIDQANVEKVKEESYSCSPSDKLIDVQIRYVENSVLDDYALYIILSLDSILSQKGECQNYLSNKVFRCRMYQLYIMQESLFGFLCPMSSKESAMFLKLFSFVDNMIQQFYSPELSFVPASAEEREILEGLIKPRVVSLKRGLISKEPGDNIKISGKAYHFEDPLELTISREVYHLAMKKIKETYLCYV